MSSSELAARRGVDYCCRLVKNQHLSFEDVIEEVKSNRSRPIQAAGEQLEVMRQQLRKDVLHFLQCGQQRGLLEQFSAEKLAKIMEKQSRNHIRFQEPFPEPSPSHNIPTLDMSRLQIESPRDTQGKIETPKTPLVSDIAEEFQSEPVEVSDSSAYDSQIFETMADNLLQKMEEKRLESSIPTLYARKSAPGMVRSQNLDFSKLPMGFIPSSPLRKESNSAEIGVQTKKTALESDKVDAATSYSFQHFQDIGEASTSENSDGQIDQMRFLPSKVITVKNDGSLVLSPAEINWKPPLELIRIAEKDISSSFGSEIETISARKMAHSDEEPTVNQVSLLESDASG